MFLCVFEAETGKCLGRFGLGVARLGTVLVLHRGHKIFGSRCGADTCHSSFTSRFPVAENRVKRESGVRPELPRSGMQERTL